MLASLGAEVVKVEPPRGDPGRHLEPFFSLVNRGKKSVVLDLREEAGRASMRRLIAGSDVLLEGFRPGVAARLGCDAATARGLKPELVYCSISAFGQEGPRRDEPGHDLNLQALAGLCHLERGPSGPRGTVLPIADLSSSLVAVASICAALARGGGATLDVAMSDAALSFAQVWGEGIDLVPPDAPRVAAPFLAAIDRRKLFSLPHYGLFQTRDRGWVAIGVVDERHFWERLCSVLGLAPLARLPMPARVAAGPLLRRLIARRVRRHRVADLLALLREADVPATEVLDVARAKEDPQVRARGLVDDEGRVRAPLPGAIHLSGVPALGEHNGELL